MTGPFLVYTVLLLLDSVKAGISSHGRSLGAISCVKCLDDGCLNATKGWRSQNGKDDNVWDRNGLGNSIPVCGFYSPPSETWYHVCQKNHTVFMVTNDSEAGVSFALEASGKDLKFERKTGNECPTLEPEPPTTGYTKAISVNCPTKRYVVILFQPVTLTCNYQTSSTQPPVVTWRYKSYCRDPIQAALNPSSAENALAQANPNYNPNIECADSQRTVRIVASKQGNAVTLGEVYQGRKISILNNADLNIAQTAWGDSGVYVCSVVSSQDLTGNSEDYTELIVLERKSNTTDLLPGIDLLVMEDWLLVLLLVLGFLLLLLLIGICWCQCCPHTCCCYIRCPCCPERCCCPRALYEAGKAVKSGGAYSQYAPTMYAPPSLYAQPVYAGGMNPPPIPMLPMPNSAAGPPPSNGYNRDYDVASSVGQGSQVPLLQESGGNPTRSGYRIQATPDGNPTRVLYYMEQELANLDPSRPGVSSGNHNRMDVMSEVSSLHDGLDPRSRGRAQPPALPTVYDHDDNMSTISSVSQQGRRDNYDRRGGAAGYAAARGRARSMDNLDDIGRGHRDRDDYPPQRREGGARGGRRGSDDGWSGSGGGGRGGQDRDRDTPRRRDYSPDDRRGYQGKRSRSRDDLMDLERGRGGRDAYDDSFLREAMEKKKLGEQQRARSRDRLDSDADRLDRGRGPRGPPPLPQAAPSSVPDRRQYGGDGFPPPPPPPYSDDESVSSSKRSNLRKNGAVSRESLVV
ncbi:lipolysis-stimulated lipoprotein receptor isoform X3 [Anguilla rostrata]|uniref:lipolysis-stimulated lipoprotein receptor isoform X3 n=1 Tax=Anguilla rostrata TaxID=7938 RepID=UPI0030D338B4